MIKNRIVFTIFILFFQTNFSIAVEYTITDVGLGNANAINNLGQIAGSFGIWTDGLIDHSGIVDHVNMGWVGINNVGDAIGTKFVSRGIYHAIRIENGIEIDMGTIDGTGSSYGYAINNLGHIAGSLSSTNRAFLFKDGQMQSIDCSYGVGSIAYGINDYDQVDGGSGGKAVLWQNNQIQDLGTLGGYSMARAINNLGQIVGESTIPGEGHHAFVWDSTQGMRDLGTLGFGESHALGINNNGDIVGDIYDYQVRGAHAFLYKDNEMLDLNSLLPPDSPWLVLNSAKAINDKGQIIGYGLLKEDYPYYQGHAFLMTPIPEPVTLLLLGVGGLLVKQINSKGAKWKRH